MATFEVIKERINKLFKEIPANVKVIAATKGRTIEEIKFIKEAGLDTIGENYVQEAEKKFKVLGKTINWHFIGHLQKNKVKKCLKIFDLIQTVDNFLLAKEIDKEAKILSKVVPIFIEINSAREPQKFGVFPENTLSLVEEISLLSNLKIKGLMTMGPLTNDKKFLRTCFKEVKKIFDELKENRLKNVELEYLSMGMSDSYKIAIEEGANLIRIGRLIFEGS